MDDHENIDIDDDEGELMVGMGMDARREALDRHRSTTTDTQSRLSRELEEGFMDDSDNEDSERDSAGNRH